MANNKKYDIEIITADGKHEKKTGFDTPRAAREWVKEQRRAGVEIRGMRSMCERDKKDRA